jgi:hypothetical protein
MSGNAWKYLILLRRSLLAEVEPQNNEDGVFDGNLKKSLSTYWGMFRTKQLRKLGKLGLYYLDKFNQTGVFICHK